MASTGYLFTHISTRLKNRLVSKAVCDRSKLLCVNVKYSAMQIVFIIKTCLRKKALKKCCSKRVARMQFCSRFCEAVRSVEVDSLLTYFTDETGFYSNNGVNRYWLTDNFRVIHEVP